MSASLVTTDAATQTPDFESDDDPFLIEENPNSSPRVVIDTSPPFGSVEEAVIRFGGRGWWIPGFIPDVDVATGATDQNKPEQSNIRKLEKKAAEMLKELQLKEKQSQEILQELELTKRLLEELKLKLPNESPFLGFEKDSVKEYVDMVNNEEPAALIMTELKQAKLNLYQNTNELASIRSCVESLSKKMDEEKSSVKKGGNDVKHIDRSSSVNPLVISRELRELNYEADQFMKTAEKAKSEVLRAVSEIDQTKNGLKVIELRWLTAKKLEEAARAAESLALAEIRALSSNESVGVGGGGISLSVEEYSALTDKVRKAESLLKREDFRNSITSQPRRDPRLLDSNEFEFVRNGPRPKTRVTTSIGEILSRKLVMKDDFEVGREEAVRERVSLNQMLRRHRGESSPRRRRESGGGESKGLFSKRKGLGLVHISFPLSKHGKNKIQALNLW